MAERSIKQQAERAIGRRLAYITELHYPNFYAASVGRDVTVRMEILGFITLNVHLRLTPARLPRLEYCTDLSEVERTISSTGHLLDRLRRIASQVELRRHLLADSMTTEEAMCLEDMKRDTQRGSMSGIDRALSRLERLIVEPDPDTDEAWDPTEELTLDQLLMRARARRIVGVPPCMDIHSDLNCRCCVFDT